ncbi:MAG: hypothetical protein ACFFD2_23185, partial [Promethearchaeota archaeon]
IIVSYVPINWISQIERRGAPQFTSSIARSFGRMNKKITSLFCMICPIQEMTEFNTKISLQFKDVLWKKDIPHFESIAGAATALNHAIEYCEHLKKRP